MKLGLVGLPNAGKSTLFNALTGSAAAAAAHPFSTVDKNVGIVPIFDRRLEVLQKIYRAKQVIYATIEFVDIAGLIRGSGGGAGLGNKFLGHIREMDGLVHVSRCFDDENVPHVEGTTDPVRDAQTIGSELIFADFELGLRRLEKLRKESKSGKGDKAEIALIEKVLAILEDDTALSAAGLGADERGLLDSLGFLTLKPMVYVANTSEEQVQGNEHTARLADWLAAQAPPRELYIVAAKMEEELVALEEDQREEFLNELGIKKSGLSQITAAGYACLDLMSFLTAGTKAARAWTIPAGTKAVRAAGKIHSDIERGFIRAEVVSFEELENKGSYAACKDAGLVRLEGKEYIIKEGEVVQFRFNV